MPDIGFNLNDYVAHFKGGARQYLFYFAPSFPTGVLKGSDLSPTYLVRSTTLPGSDFEEIITNWQGYDYKIAGKRVYADWTVTFNVDRMAKILSTFKTWERVILDPTSNVHGAPDRYLSDQHIILLDGNGNNLVKYKLIGAWPKSIADITLDYATSDVAQFDVTFSYQYHVVIPKYDTIGYANLQSKVG